MFIITAKLPIKRLPYLVATAALVVCCSLSLTLTNQSVQSSETVSALVQTKVKTNEDRIAFLQHYGWTVSEEPISVEDLQLPAVSDQSFQTLLALQQEQGFPLSDYAGQTVKRYTYQITNYPNNPNVLAQLLIHKSTIIGGLVFSPELDGFLHGLSAPNGEGHL